MNIKIEKKTLSEVLALKKEKKFIPKKPNMLFRTLLKVLSSADLKHTNFQAQKIGMEKLGKKEPCLVLMNHSSFIDLKIAETLFYPRPLNIVTTFDGFVGMRWLMRQLGCFPTKKFVPEMQVIKDIHYCIEQLKTSVLLFPEAGYSFDGTATTLPESLGKFIKHLEVPVVTVISMGAFSRQPLFNNLHRRKVNVSAKMEYLLSPSDIASFSAAEINEKIAKAFTFDAFAWQKDNGIIINEPNRAEGLNRLLYKCPNCLAEGKMVGEGDTLSCKQCGKVYRMTEQGAMQALEGETEIPHIPEWYVWERNAVKEELLNGSYRLDDEVEIFTLVNMKKLYTIGNGRLIHTTDGFTLYGENGEIVHEQKPLFTYSLNVDYYWYEIGDVICIGNSEITYCCVPKNPETPVTKARLAAEELYKLKKSNQL